ncbi:type II toxin-antitoxin system PemK/MazF family toxin [Kribbella sp. NPDC056951]|uniref:type II toxin-antitoxin system PemK/MazF family toxin n=1 Tax=Kribbella sp. NPDC056951 TaxID=3345978 RepID=UPI00362C9BDF
MSWPLLRGQVVRADLDLDEPKLFVVVSNNRRNQYLQQVLAVRLTTTAKPQIPSIVELVHPEAFVGRAVCDDIVELYADEVDGVVGGLSPAAMRAINSGLAAALGMSD